MPEVKDTTDRFVAAFNAHDERALDAVHADNIKFNAPGGFKATNAKEATAFAMTWLKAFPDGKMKVRSEIISGPWVVQEVVMEGTHTRVRDLDRHRGRHGAAPVVGSAHRGEHDQRRSDSFASRGKQLSERERDLGRVAGDRLRHQVFDDAELRVRGPEKGDLFRQAPLTESR